MSSSGSRPSHGATARSARPGSATWAGCSGPVRRSDHRTCGPWSRRRRPGAGSRRSPTPTVSSSSTSRGGLRHPATDRGVLRRSKIRIGTRSLRTLPVKAIGDVIDGTGPNWDIVSGRDTLDEFWQGPSLRRPLRPDRRALPARDGVVRPGRPARRVPPLRAHAGLSPARGTQYLLVGPWSHVKSRYPDRECGGVDFGPEAAYDMDAEHLRWFDYWLKGIDTGVDELDRVRVFEPGRNAWRGATAWPLSNSALSLTWAPGSRLSADRRRPSRDGFRYDPLQPGTYGDGRAQVPVRGCPARTDRKRRARRRPGLYRRASH